MGATEHPVQSWVVQQARNLLMDLDDAGMNAKFILHDRDAGFTAAFAADIRPPPEPATTANEPSYLHDYELSLE